MATHNHILQISKNPVNTYRRATYGNVSARCITCGLVIKNYKA